LIFAIYLGVMAIRFVLVFAFGPLCDRFSDGVSAKDNLVISWGGLRGAVSLALGLIVSQDQRIPEQIRSRILLVTAGVVLLTIVVNGMSIGKLLSRLGFDQPQLSVQVQNLSARVHILDRVSSELREVSQSPDLRTCQWTNVLSDLDVRRAGVKSEL
jgi:NhaP-type Na+/H+ or K+/H+ antiporter